MSSLLYGPDHMDETLHYVHDECRCVTVRWTCRTLGISRPAAQALLEDVVLHEHNKRQCTYDIIRLETKVDEVTANFNENGTTVKKRTVRLVRETVDSSATNTQRKNNNNAPIYSVALRPTPDTPAPSVYSAHEYDNSQMRDMIDEEKQDVVFNAKLLYPSVRPAFGEVLKSSCKDISRSLHQVRKTNGSSGEGPKNMSTSSYNTKKIIVPRKTTTAESFFATTNNNDTKKKESSTKATTKLKKSSSISTITPKPKSEKSIFSASSNSNNNSKKKPVATKKRKKNEEESRNDFANDDDDDEEMSCSSTDSPAAPRNTRKKSRSGKKNDVTNSKNHGNADDFVGDEDSDEDDWKQDADRKRRLALEKRKQIRDNATVTTTSSSNNNKKKAKTRAEVQEERIEEEDSHIVVEKEEDEESNNKGRMDVLFARKTAIKETAATTTRRIKKLVDKNFIDDDGYMQTETVTVWEDVPEDDIPVPVVAKQKKSSLSSNSTSTTAAKKKKPKAMKQAGLMGFFAKKK